MAKSKKDDKEITVVAELEVKFGDQVETIRTFDKAWHRLLLVPTPATMSFKQWARKDSKLGSSSPV
jgi:hypothetical protein